MDISTCLIEHNDGSKVLTTSGIVLDNKFSIFPASIFLVNLPEVPNYLLKIPSGELYFKNYFKINNQNTKIIIPKDKNEKTKSIKFYACFSCKNLKNTQNFPLVPHDLESYEQITFILSLFLIVSLEFESNEFSTCINSLLGSCVPPIRGSQILVESTPFGSRDLICTLTKGIVSNNFGENESYFLIDAATAPGSEGGAVFLNQKKKR